LSKKGKKKKRKKKEKKGAITTRNYNTIKNTSNHSCPVNYHNMPGFLLK